MIFGHLYGLHHPFPELSAPRLLARLIGQHVQGRAGITAGNASAFPIYDDGRPDMQIRGSLPNVRSTSRLRHRTVKLLRTRVSGWSRRPVRGRFSCATPGFGSGWLLSARVSDTSWHPANSI